MKKLLLKFCVLMVVGFSALTAYANPYNITLVQAPTVLSNASTGYIVYSVSTKQYQRLDAGIGNIFPGTRQTTINPNPGLYDRICGNPFNLGAPNSSIPNYCYLVLAVAGPAFPDGGQVSGSIIICDSPPIAEKNKEEVEGNCFYGPSVNFPVVTPPSPLNTTISVSPPTITLGPNSSASWTITNTGDQPAYNINVDLNRVAEDFLPFGIPTSCANIPATQSCVITATVTSNPVFITPPSGVTITFSGDNTNQASTTVVVVDTGELAPIGSPDIVIEEATNIYCVQYQNILSAPNSITITSVMLNSGAVGVEPVAPPDMGAINCEANPTLTAGQICDLCYYAPTTTASGNTTYEIFYSTTDRINDTTTGNVTVIPTFLEITPGVIGVPGGTTGNNIYTIEVSGAFDLVGNPSPSLFGTEGIVLGDIPIACNNLAVSDPFGTCQPPYTYASATATPDAVLPVTGSNVGVPGQANIVITSNEGPEIYPTPDSLGGQHLQYGGITVDNTNNPSQSFNLSADLTGISGYAKICSSVDPTCEYVSTCDGAYTATTFVGTIAGNATCEFFVASITPTNQSFGVQGPGTLSIVGGTRSAVIFDVYQQLALYATGLFNLAGSTTVNNIAKYDGTNWQTLNFWQGIGFVGVDNGLSGGTGNVVEVYKGDLYVGGEFVNASGAPNSRYVASWNGFQWNGLVSNSANRLNGLVYDMAPMTNANGVSGTTLPLYIGGQFSSAGGISARNMAQYVNNASGINGTLAPLANNAGNGVTEFFSTAVVYGLFASGTNVFTAGDFTSTTPTISSGYSPYNIAYWTQSNSTWNALDAGINNIIGGGYVSAATTDNAGNIYATGGFLGTFGSLFPCGFGIPIDFNVLKFNGTCWTIADGNDPFPAGFSGPGNDIINSNGTIIAGGLFPCRADLSDFGNTPINNVSYLGGGQWQRLGGGLGDLTTIFGTNYCVPANLFEINYVYTLETYNNILYAGGFFNVSPATNHTPRVTGLHNIAAFPLNNISGGAWSGIGGGVQNTHYSSNVIVTGIAITSSLLLH